MTAEELKAEIAIEFEALQQVVHELESLRRDVAGRQPTVREKVAAAAFLAQFYSGIENILKRLSRFHGVELPTAESWHLDLFKRFCPPEYPRCLCYSTMRSRANSAPTDVSAMSSTTATDFKSNGIGCGKGWTKSTPSW